MQNQHNKKKVCFMLLVLKSVTKFLHVRLKKSISKYKEIRERLRGYTHKASIKELKYVDLAPVNDIEKEDVYFKALDWAIADEKVRNIALTGPYGSGKSSIIQAYLKNRQHIRYLDISLASFCEAKTDGIENDIDEEEVKFTEQEIEEGVLKQLFYKVDYKKIPHSRYRKIHNLHYKTVAIALAIVISIFTILYMILKTEEFLAIQDTIDNAATSIGIDNTVLKYTVGATSALAWLLISYILWLIVIKFKIARISLVEKAEMEQNTTADSTVFNKNLDEILYFFESNKYEVVFIEDLDRFSNSKIFSKLRELNYLINSYEKIKRRIVFVYAVKDDMFTKEDRTKFFDFIIPVIPIINSTNSGEKIRKRISEDGIDAAISDAFINMISVYIEDMRMLNNIFNEFMIFRSITNDIEGLYEEKMFTLITFKNLYPKEFMDLQYEKGIVYQAFIDKRKFINEYKNKYRNEKNKYETILENIESDCLKSVEEVKQILLYRLVGYGKIVNRIDLIKDNNNYSSPEQINYATYMDDKFELSTLIVKKIQIHYEYIRGSYSDTSSKNLDLTLEDENLEVIKDAIKRIEYLKYNNETEKNRLLNEIDKYHKKEYKVQSYKLAELLKENDVKDVLCEEVCENKFLVFTLRNGYIDEYYANYLNYFYPNSITNVEMNFIMSVRNREFIGSFNYELPKVQQVANRLEVYEFEQKEVYNMNLMECLLLDIKSKTKCDTFIQQLADDTEESHIFIEEFIGTYLDKEEVIYKFINLLCHKWYGFWEYIESKVTLGNDNKQQYLILILEYADIGDIYEIANCSNLRQFIIDEPNILHIIAEIEEEKQISIIERLGVKFTSLNCEGIDEKILDFIFDNAYYVINQEMVRNIIDIKASELAAGLDSANYTTINRAEYEPLVDNINQHLEEYVSNVLLQINTNTDEDIEMICKLLNEMIEDVNLCIAIIEKEKFVIDDINVINNSNEENQDNLRVIWESLIKTNKVKVTWKNILSYYEKYDISGINPILKVFIEENINELKEQSITKDINKKVDGFMQAIVMSTLNEQAYRILIEIIEVDITQISWLDITDERLIILIENDFFPLITPIYAMMQEKNIDVRMAYILKNKKQYISNIEEYALEDQDVVSILENNRFSVEEKLKVIEAFGYMNITNEIANKIYDYQVEMQKELVERLWDMVTINNRYELLYNQLDKYSNQEVADKFIELGGVYEPLANNSKKVRLVKTEYNEKLLKALYEREYISREAEIERDNESGEEMLTFRIKRTFS